MEVKINVQPDGAQRIAKERKRQVAKENWSHEHDDQHSDGSLASAAAAYLVRAIKQIEGQEHDPDVVPNEWPWEPEDYNPSPEPVRNLEKAGALIAAEIDRILRAKLYVAVEGANL